MKTAVSVSSVSSIKIQRFYYHFGSVVGFFLCCLCLTNHFKLACYAETVSSTSLLWGVQKQYT